MLLDSASVLIFWLTSAVTRAGKSVSEARELARWLLRSLRDRVPQTEEDARITVGSNALLN